MGLVRQNPIQRTVSLFICVCIALCTIVAHNIAQNRPDSFPPYPPDNHHISDDVYLREGGLCCHSNATRAPIANLPNSAQLGGIPCHSPSYIRVPAIVWACGRGQTDRQTQTRVTTIHFASSTTYAKCSDCLPLLCGVRALKLGSAENLKFSELEIFVFRYSK